MPAMQPAKPLATSKIAALASVVGDGQTKQIRRDAFGLSRGVVAGVEKLDRPASPDGPMAQQPSDDPSLDLPAADREPVRSEQVEHDVVVVAGVEGDVVAPGFGDGPDDVEGPVAVERSDLDGDDRLDFGEPPPEAIRQVRAADGLLKVEADERDHLGDGPAMGQPRVVVGAGTGEAEQSGVIAEVAQDRRPRRSPGRSDRRSRRSAPAAPAGRRRLDRFPRRRGPVPGDTGRAAGREWRTGSCERRRRSRRHRRRCNTGRGPSAGARPTVARPSGPAASRGSPHRGEGRRARGRIEMRHQ